MKIARGIHKYLGFMFRTRKTESLTFLFNKPTYFSIHSLFVFFSFEVIWYFEDGTSESRHVKPFQWGIKPSKPYIKFVEMPLGENNE